MTLRPMTLRRTTTLAALLVTAIACAPGTSTSASASAPTSGTDAAPAATTTGSATGIATGVTAASTVTETVVAGAPTVLDHGGLGPIRLGDTFAEVEATGLIGGRSSPATRPCAYHDFVLPLRGSVVFDQSRTAVSIIITRGPGTPEGLRNGDEPARVPELYPSAVANEYGHKVALDTGNEYSAYSIDGTVITSLGLSRIGQTCHE
ncbi:hypothetical protein CKY47_03955 [Saccharothrix yanglingensis]|uniref:Secreted protein n=2 Tax=Saccharothrix yanglingensis TaxID=659496 RepID=A0ABU0WVP3_9PSEU|nr:hypothetical protein [Saccharothrix yanglingensis]